MTTLNEALLGWLEANTDGLDTAAADGDALLARLAGADLFRIGVPAASGGAGGDFSASVRSVAALAEKSLAAAFVFWAQRAVIECLLASPNRELAARLLPALLDGRLAGAPGLSDAMKFLGGLDRLRVSRAAGPDGVRLDGTLPWATNLHRQGFVALVAAGDESGGEGGDDPSVFAVPHHAPGVLREPDLDLLALRATNTAALRLDGVALDPSWQIHPQARVFLPAIRPAFVGLQCGLGLGLARAAIDAARRALDGRPSILDEELAALEAEIEADWQALSSGLDEGRLREQPRELLSLRLRMAGMATQAVGLELQALGGRALLRGQDGGHARRAREAAFLAVLTPTVAQLKGDLAQKGSPAARPADR